MPVSREDASYDPSSGGGEPAPETSSTGEPGSGLFQAYYKEGESAFKRGRFRDAVAYFKEALSQDPDSAAANKYLGLALMEAGDLKGAQTYLSKALELDPRAAVAREKLEFIQARLK